MAKTAFSKEEQEAAAGEGSVILHIAIRASHQPPNYLYRDYADTYSLSPADAVKVAEYARRIASEAEEKAKAEAGKSAAAPKSGH